MGIKRYCCYLITFLFGFVAGEYIAYYSISKQKATSGAYKKETNGFILGFSNIKQEQSKIQLKTSGKIPNWLTGSFVQVGPGFFELNGTQASNCCSGLSLLHAFSFKKGKIFYQNKFLKTNQRKKILQAGTMHPEPKKSIFSKVSSAVFSSSKKPPYDNANINICKHGNTYFAMTETPAHIVFDPNTLNSKGTFNYKDSVDCQFCTAHPLYDANNDSWYNVGITFGRKSFYTIYKIKNGTNKRSLVASIPVKYPAYLHSFAMSNKYIILTEMPFRVNVYNLALTDKPFIENFTWESKEGNQFIVVEKETGNIVKKLKTKSFFTFHHVCATEKKDNLVLDIITYEDPSIFDAYYLKKLCQPIYTMPQGKLERFTIDLKKETVQVSTLSSQSIAIPKIASQKDNYQFIYGVASDTPNNFTNQIVKVDVLTGKNLIWQQEGCYTREAVFVPNPKGKSEDDGVLLSVVLDTVTNTSFLIILHAQTFKEIGRATVDVPLPFIIHGNYFS